MNLFGTIAVIGGGGVLLGASIASWCYALAARHIVRENDTMRTQREYLLGQLGRVHTYLAAARHPALGRNQSAAEVTKAANAAEVALAAFVGVDDE